MLKGMEKSFFFLIYNNKSFIICSSYINSFFSEKLIKQQNILSSDQVTLNLYLCLKCNIKL
jgi:hypothetical protein